MRLVHGSGATGLQLVQSISDSDEDSDGAWEGRLGHRYDPPGNLFQRKNYFHRLFFFCQKILLACY